MRGAVDILLNTCSWPKWSSQAHWRVRPSMKSSMTPARYELGWTDGRMPGQAVLTVRHLLPILIWQERWTQLCHVISFRDALRMLQSQISATRRPSKNPKVRPYLIRLRQTQHNIPMSINLHPPPFPKLYTPLVNSPLTTNHISNSPAYPETAHSNPPPQSPSAAPSQPAAACAPAPPP